MQKKVLAPSTDCLDPLPKQFDRNIFRERPCPLLGGQQHRALFHRIRAESRPCALFPDRVGNKIGSDRIKSKRIKSNRTCWHDTSEDRKSMETAQHMRANCIKSSQERRREKVDSKYDPFRCYLLYGLLSCLVFCFILLYGSVRREKKRKKKQHRDSNRPKKRLHCTTPYWCVHDTRANSCSIVG